MKKKKVDIDTPVKKRLKRIARRLATRAAKKKLAPYVPMPHCQFAALTADGPKHFLRRGTVREAIDAGTGLMAVIDSEAGYANAAYVVKILHVITRKDKVPVTVEKLSAKIAREKAEQRQKARQARKARRRR